MKQITVRDKKKYWTTRWQCVKHPLHTITPFEWAKLVSGHIPRVEIIDEMKHRMNGKIAHRLMDWLYGRLG